MTKKHTLLLTLPFLVACGTPTPSSASGLSSKQSSASGLSSQQSTSQSSQQSSASQSASQSASGLSSQAQGDYLFYNLKQGQTKDGLTGSPWLNVTPVGIAAKVEKPTLKQDFYLSSNYDYLSTATLQPGQIGDGGSIGAINVIQQRYLDLGSGKANKGNYAAAIKKAYELYTAQDKAKDIAAVKALIAEIQAISTKEQLASFLVSKKGASFAFSIFELMRTENGAAVYDNNLGWTMSSSVIPIHNGDTQGIENITTKYGTILAYFGIPEAEAKGLALTALQEESELRGSCGQPVSSEGYKVSELNGLFQSIPLGTLFKNFGYADTDTIAFDETVFNIYGNIHLSTASDLAKIKADLILRAALGGKTVLPEDMYLELAQEFDSNTAGFSPDMLSRERFVEATQLVYDRSFVDNYETKARKDLVMDLMAETKAQYVDIVGKAEWLSQATKAKAQEKLEAIKFDACYPDHILSLPAFALDASIDNFFAAGQAYRQWAFSKSQPFQSNPGLWAGSLTMVNAVYMGDRNSFVYYDGLMSVVDYSASQIEEMYGAVGAVIGHEISHSIDSNGAQYDKDGRPVDWWTPEDKATYLAKQQKVIAAWDKMSYREGTKMWSEKMLGEIIADMGGVSVMLDLASKKANFDYEKFFRAYSASYASVFSEEFVEQMFYSRQDEHPMNYLRVNAVVNQFAKFQDVFGVQSGDPMYVAPADRIAIW